MAEDTYRKAINRPAFATRWSRVWSGRAGWLWGSRRREFLASCVGERVVCAVQRGRSGTRRGVDVARRRLQRLRE
jgi:hypothetical protein